MSFQLKIFIVFVLSILVVFSIINFITIYFFTQELQKNEKILLEAYEIIVKSKSDVSLPKYIKRDKDKIFIDISYSQERFKDYYKALLIWETTLITILVYLFYKITQLILKKEKDYEEFLRFLFFILSHKIGNYLSVVKTNLEILNSKYSPEVINRIKNKSENIDTELREIIETVKKIPNISSSKKKLNLKDVINKLISKFETDKKVIINVKSYNLRINPTAIEVILFLILDNAYRYSNTYIHIKSLRNSIAIRNDFSEIMKGSGVGLQIAEFLCNLNKIKIKYRAKKNNFFISLTFT